MNNVGKYVSNNGIENQNINSENDIFWNFGPELLYEHTIKQGLGVMSKGSALVVETGQHTGRSANDKYMVEEPTSKDNIWWGKVNKAISEEKFNIAEQQIIAYLNKRI